VIEDAPTDIDRFDLLAAQIRAVAAEVHTITQVSTIAAEEARGAHTQARKTNGRVTELENTVYGDLRPGREQPGLRQQMQAAQPTLEQMRSLNRKITWLLALLPPMLTGTVIVLVNRAFGE
jgi:hypothetical protein